jgi:hypothetical protein
MTIMKLYKFKIKAFDVKYEQLVYAVGYSISHASDHVIEKIEELHGHIC